MIDYKECHDFFFFGMAWWMTSNFHTTPCSQTLSAFDDAGREPRARGATQTALEKLRRGIRNYGHNSGDHQREILGTVIKKTII